MSDAPQADATASLRRVRWAQGIAFGVVGFALVATAAQSLIGAQRSAETLTIGQGRRLLEAVQRAHHRLGPDIDQKAAVVLKQHEEFGLRCIGLFRRNHVRRFGDCVLSESAMREVLADAVPDRPMTVGDHVVMIDDPGRGSGPPGGGPPRGMRSGDAERRGPPPDTFGGDTDFERRGPPPGMFDGDTDGERRGPPPGTFGGDTNFERRGPPPGTFGGDTDFERRGPPPDMFNGNGDGEMRGQGSRRGPPRGYGRRGPPRRGGPGGKPILPPVLIEFEPIEAETLEASVATGAIVALFAVLALVVSGVALFRLTRRAELLQEEAERDRRLVTLGEMASVLAHEIRNPLAALKGHAQLLTEQLPSDGREARGAERVVRSAIRLESLTEDLLSLVRSSQVDRRAVSPMAIVRESLAQVDFDRFEIDASKAPETWQLDPNRMQQVFVNLLQNAADASPETAHVDVVVTARDGRLVVFIRDYGDGIPEGEEDRIFDPFFTKRTQGTGLGLAVARRIVELHGGTIAGRNLDPAGAEFEVVIP